MSARKLIVWSVWPGVDPADAWDALTAALPGGLLVGALPLRASTQVVSGTPGWRVTTRTTLAGVTLVHRRRLERVLGGGVRATDELVVQGGRVAASVAVRALRRWLVARHRALSAKLAPTAGVVARARVYVLDAGNAAHAEDSLTGLPDDAD